MPRDERVCGTSADLIVSLLRDTDDVFAVTGATGWLGAVVLDLLYSACAEQAAERVVGYASSVREVVVSGGRVAKVRPLAELITQIPTPTRLLHVACVTRDKVSALGVDSFTGQNLAILATVLDAIAQHRPRHVVVASSGAVYSATGGLVSDLRMDPYGTLKQIDELAFRAATRDVGGVCVIPRVFSVAGARMIKPELYALGSTIQMAVAGGPIEVRARGPVFRSYCGVDEVVALALWAARAGRSVVFDSCGPAVEIGELAALIAQAHGLDRDTVRRTWDLATVENRYVGDGRLMEELASEAGLPL